MEMFSSWHSPPPLDENPVSRAAPLIFLFTVVLQLVPFFLRHQKKKGTRHLGQLQLRQEIKSLLREASSLSNQSTFVQAAKLRRTAAAKEKELLKIQELHKKEYKVVHDAYLKVLMIVKVVVYGLLILWFWSNPVAAVSQKLMQPFGKVLSRVGDPATGLVTVGIVPWLILTGSASLLAKSLLDTADSCSRISEKIYLGYLLHESVVGNVQIKMVCLLQCYHDDGVYCKGYFCSVPFVYYKL